MQCNEFESLYDYDCAANATTVNHGFYPAHWIQGLKQGIECPLISVLKCQRIVEI